MPKRLSHEQLEVLHSNGGLAPVETPRIEPGEVLRALGATGLPQEERVDQLDETNETDVTPVTQETSLSFSTSLERAFAATEQLMALTGEHIPAMYEFLTHNGVKEDVLEQHFTKQEQIGLQPDIVITPSGRPWLFWERFYGLVEKSVLNPEITRNNNINLLRHGGLRVYADIRHNWDDINDDDVNYRVEVVSGLPMPYVRDVTACGYADSANHIPHKGFNKLLEQLGLPSVEDQSTWPLLSQPDVLPRIDTYLMQQLIRITTGQEPIDTESSTIFRNSLDLEAAPSGDFTTTLGSVRVRLDGAGHKSAFRGIRPAQDGRYA